MKVVVIGGGVIGLSSAYFLQEAGHSVTVIDQTDISNNCSYGNAGYVCPSHFVPLATPGIVKQGLKWMLNPQSPFYVKPRLSWSLMQWGLKFMQMATPENVEKAAMPLKDFALVSQHWYEEWAKLPQFKFAYEHKGLLEIFQTDKVADHSHHLVKKAHELGLTDTRLLNQEELFALEPQHKMNAIGAVYFACDAHLYPNKLMKQLIEDLKSKGVQFCLGETVKSIEEENGKIKSVITDKNKYTPDAVVLATGSWSREMVQQLGITMPLMPGRGYSITLENSPYQTNYPSVLVEGRVALTPMDGNKMRFGGTMEITTTQAPPQMNRVVGVLKAVKKFFPEFDIPTPSWEQVWYGYRPCSADGLPYLGRSRKIQNLVIATGHSMIGLSLGAGTGKLVAEIMDEKPASIDISFYNPERFDR
ncbi:MAG: FAD-dependent oxidoreductase [Chitinophagaceae bacterium]|nr:MAG: FAD-dependent oxidoreductase [Chitinophagaceae bacterium]